MPAGSRAGWGRRCVNMRRKGRKGLVCVVVACVSEREKYAC